MEPLTLLAGGLLLFAGWVVGRNSRRRTRTPKLVCSCKHGYGAHENGGACRDEVKRPSRWSSGYIMEYAWVECACMEYDGPEPLPRMLRELGE